MQEKSKDTEYWLKRSKNNKSAEKCRNTKIQKKQQTATNVTVLQERVKMIIDFIKKALFEYH